MSLFRLLCLRATARIWVVISFLAVVLYNHAVAVANMSLAANKVCVSVVAVARPSFRSPLVFSSHHTPRMTAKLQQFGAWTGWLSGFAVVLAGIGN